MPLLSNPFAKEKPRAGEPLYQESELWTTRLRDSLIRPLFYHKERSFFLIALLAVVGLSLCIVPWFFPALGLGIAIASTIIGGLVASLVALSIYINSYLFGWEDTDTKDEYKEAMTEVYDANGLYMGKASLKYFRGTEANGHNKVPQLTIQADTHYQSGYIQGYQLAKQGDKLLTKLKKLYASLRLLNVLGYQISAWADKKMMVPFFEVLPEVQKEELRGLVEGHNQWAKAHRKPLISIDDLVMLHLLPDSHNIKKLMATGELLASGCTAGLIKDSEGQIIHFRNTDWPSYNMVGRVSLLIERQITNKEHSRIVSFPLCIGAEHGENSTGLTLSINVSPGGTVLNKKGKLAFFLYRELLQTCSQTKDVTEKILHNEQFQPIGPCQLTVSDAHHGAIVRFYQNASTPSECNEGTTYYPGCQGVYYFSHDVSELSNEKSIIIVANDGLKMQEGTLVQGNHHDTRQRIHNVYQKLLAKPNPGIKEAHEALQTPLVQNCESVHTIIKRGRETHFSARNGYASRFFPVPVGGLVSKSTKDEEQKDEAMSVIAA